MAHSITKKDLLKFNPQLSIPEQHQFKIAKKTLRMSDAGVNIMGGMSKEQARTFLSERCGWSTVRIKKHEDA